MRLREFAQDLDEIIMMPPMRRSMDIEYTYNKTLSDAQSKPNLVKKLPPLNIDVKNEVFSYPNAFRVFFFLDSAPVFYLALSRFHDGYKTGSVHTGSQARGQGVGVKEYLAVSDYLGVP